MPTNPEVQARRIATTQRRINDARKAAAKHLEHVNRLDREIFAHERELEWLKSMPTDETASDGGDSTTDVALPDRSSTATSTDTAASYA